MERPETSVLRHERPAIFPARGNRNEVCRRRQFDIHAQFLLEFRYGSQHGVGFGHERQIDIYRALAPSEQDRRGATGEVHAPRLAGGLRQRHHQPPDPLGVR
jgi:hypothetical protein